MPPPGPSSKTGHKLTLVSRMVAAMAATGAGELALMHDMQAYNRSVRLPSSGRCLLIKVGRLPGPAPSALTGHSRTGGRYTCLSDAGSVPAELKRNFGKD